MDKLARPADSGVVHTWLLSLLGLATDTEDCCLFQSTTVECVLVILHTRLQHFLSTLPHSFLQESLFSAVGVVRPRPESKINWCVIPRRNTLLSVILSCSAETLSC